MGFNTKRVYSWMITGGAPISVANHPTHFRRASAASWLGTGETGETMEIDGNGVNPIRKHNSFFVSCFSG